MIQQNTIKSWAEDDRPREKMMLKGRAALSDAELIAILIGSGTRELSAVQLSQQILAKAENSLTKLSKFSIDQLMTFKGIGEAKAISIFASMEIARRRDVARESKKLKITSSKDAFNSLRAEFFDLPHEEFYILLLNRANEVVAKQQISRGGISGTISDGKIIFGYALEKKASAIILAHNHPSGRLKPSEADKRLTKELIAFGKMIQLDILDHLIFSDNNYLSFADEGLM
ncbi:MAG: DNA repair protein RadC [Fluviicola sp.]|nr:DNA repair protein RadC [Fluviicola sp.]